MKRSFWISLIFIAVLLFIGREFIGSKGRTIKYRGEEFKMSKAFGSYEDYKDSAYNLETNELARIEKAITNAPIPTILQSRVELARAVLKLRFPGYGCGGRGSYGQPDGSTCDVYSVEIPMLNRERYIVGRTSGQQVTVVDDFVIRSDTNELKQVKLDGARIRYYDAEGTLFREKQM